MTTETAKLGLATNRQLKEELAARIEFGHNHPDYKTVGYGGPVSLDPSKPAPRSRVPGIDMAQYREDSLRTESPNFAAAALLHVTEEDMLESLGIISRDDPDLVKMNRLLHAAMGMNNEANEFLDHIRGVLFYGKSLDETNLKEETGDMLFFIALALTALESEFDIEAQRNINKLRARYPSKFDTDSYVNRDLDAERAVLEK